MKYYVYVHKRQNGDIVYVGKGKGVRAWDPQRTSPVHSRWILHHLSQGSTSFCEVTDWYLSEEDALRIEKEMIVSCEKLGCKLFNSQHSKYRKV